MVFDTAIALLAPRSVKIVPWEELQEILCNHCSPKPSLITRHHAFRGWTQAEGETISGYKAALRTAALHCGFRDYLEDMLLDQLVCGVRDLRLQRHLLAKRDLTLKIAIEESQAAELSELSAAEIQGNPVIQNSSAVHYDEASVEEGSDKTSDVNRLRQPKTIQRGNRFVPNQPPQSQPICLRCGGNHLRASCKFRNAICLKCQRKGHLARICQAGKTFTQPQQPRTTQYFQKQVEDRFTCYQAKAIDKGSNKISVIVSLEEKPCKMEVDTGSAVSTILWSTLKQLLSWMEKKRLQDCNLTLRDYQGRTIPVIGKGNNGLAERAVRSTKKALERLGPADWHSRLAKYFLIQLTTPCAATNRSPAELLMGRHLRTTLDRLHPNYTPVMTLGSNSQGRSFAENDQVYARKYAGHPLWLPDRIVAVTGPKSYKVQLQDSRIWCCHVHQLRGCWGTSTGGPLDVFAATRPPMPEESHRRPDSNASLPGQLTILHPEPSEAEMPAPSLPETLHQAEDSHSVAAPTEPRRSG
ncbi:hypothetical protein E2320_002962 [Naja naja]|nr:hypothetical protein E2320_002962 [Naja naja]